MRKHQVDPKFVANNNSYPGCPVVSEKLSQSLVESVSIPSLFPAFKSDTDTISEPIEIPPKFSHYSNSIVSFFPPAKSQTNNSSENYEEIIPNPSMPINGPTDLCISLLFPPDRSQTKTDGSYPESNKTPRAAAQFSNSIMSFFPPARSQSKTESSENYEIMPTDPSISARPRRTIRTTTFKHLIEFLIKRKNRNNSECNGTPPKISHSKKKSILSFFSTAKSQTDSSKNDEIRPRRTIPTATFKEFPLQMLREATNNFSEDHKIRASSFGSVYRATLDDGREVAIKLAEISMSTPNVTKRKQDNDIDFLNELEALSCLDHTNLVRLLGICNDSNVRIVVYDYMKNGTLHDHLHGLQSTPLLSWAARIKVALNAARGIEYLHMYAIPPIIHRNIKSSSILLDDTWTAKVSDFGLFVKAPVDDEAHHSISAVGTIGYLDPEFFRSPRLTTKSDVYSFGELLLELLSGYTALHRDENGQPRSVNFVVPYIGRDEIHKVLDPKVPPPTPFERVAMEHVGSLAVACVSIRDQCRPSMTEIVNRLESALDLCVSRS